MSGIEVAKEIRQRQSEGQYPWSIKLALSSGDINLQIPKLVLYDTMEEVDLFDFMLHKPVSRNKLMQVLEECHISRVGSLIKSDLS